MSLTHTQWDILLRVDTHEELLAERGFYYDLYTGQYLRMAAGGEGMERDKMTR